MDLAGFQQFVTLRKKDLRRIASHSRGDHRFDDVTQEALLLAEDMHARGMAIDWLKRQDQELLISHLYQKLVRYTDLRLRNAVRLDHSPYGDSEEGEVHPLLAKLQSDDGRHALDELIERQEAQLQPQAAEPDCHHSLAGAYLHLLRHFDNRMQAVARHLLISVSYTYRRCAQARLLAMRQQPIPLEGSSDTPFLPGAWRRFKIQRTPIQLTLDFDEESLLWPQSH